MNETFVIDGPSGRSAALAKVAGLPMRGRYEVAVTVLGTGPTSKQLKTLHMWERVVGSDLGNTPREVGDLWALEYGLPNSVHTLEQHEMGLYLDWIANWCAEVGYELPGAA